jgi:hypothetical protein
MKFILGFIPGTKSRYKEGEPQFYTHLRVECMINKEWRVFLFDRWPIDDNGIIEKSVLNLFDSKDYPDEVVDGMLKRREILPLTEEPDSLYQQG